jgi:hypothetical protein
LAFPALTPFSSDIRFGEFGCLLEASASGREGRSIKKMTMPSAAPFYTIIGATSTAVQLIGDLERGGAITSDQANLLLESWHELEDEWWSNPYLRTVREHSRAYIDQLRHQRTGSLSEATL